jgi:hypothetical protein
VQETRPGPGPGPPQRRSLEGSDSAALPHRVNAGPAALLDHRLDLVAVNRTQTAAWDEPEALDPVRRNVVWLLAAHPRTPELFPDAGLLVGKAPRGWKLFPTVPQSDRARTIALFADLARRAGRPGDHEVVPNASRPARLHARGDVLDEFPSAVSEGAGADQP